MQKFHTDDVRLAELGSASDWLKQNSLVAQPIRSTTKLWVVHIISYGTSALVSQTSFCEGSRGDLAKRRLFSQATGFFRVKKTEEAVETPQSKLQPLLCDDRFITSRTEESRSYRLNISVHRKHAVAPTGVVVHQM